MGSFNWPARIASCLLVMAIATGAPASDVVSTQTAAQGKTPLESPLLGRILARWKAREQRTISLHYRAQLRTPVPRNIVRQEEDDGESDASSVALVPFRIQFWTKGKDCFRNDTILSGNASDLFLKRLATRFWWRADRSCNGAQSARLDVTDEPPHGRVWNGIQDLETKDSVVDPVLLTFRPFSRGGRAIALEQFRLVTEHAIVDGRHCVKIQTVDDKAVPVENLWVDTARDDVVVFWERIRAEDSREWSLDEIAIRYEHRAEVGWIPIGWTAPAHWLRGRGRGKRGDVECTINPIAVNERIPRATFALTFPRGTKVIDEVDCEEYVVAADGSKSDRLQFAGPAGLKIYKALDAPCDLMLDPQPLRAAIERIGQHFDFAVKVDLRGPPEVAIDPAIGVGGLVKGLTLRQMLDRILRQCPKPVRYRIENGVLVIEPAPRGSRH